MNVALSRYISTTWTISRKNLLNTIQEAREQADKRQQAILEAIPRSSNGTIPSVFLRHFGAQRLASAFSGKSQQSNPPWLARVSPQPLKHPAASVSAVQRKHGKPC